MPLEAVFLDLGNTLLCERGSRASLYAAEARAFGLEVSPADMAAHMSRMHALLPRVHEGEFRYSDGWFRAFQRAIFVERLGLAPQRFEDLSARLFARFEDPESFALYPGARSLLATVREHGLRIGLISNWSARLPCLLEGLGLVRAFDFVLGSAQLEMEKPEPEIFYEALERAGVPAMHCLHAGDSLECDVRGAMNAGIPAVHIDHGGRTAAPADGSYPVVSSLSELTDLILARLT